MPTLDRSKVEELQRINEMEKALDEKSETDSVFDDKKTDTNTSTEVKKFATFSQSSDAPAGKKCYD